MGILAVKLVPSAVEAIWSVPPNCQSLSSIPRTPTPALALVKSHSFSSEIPLPQSLIFKARDLSGTCVRFGDRRIPHSAIAAPAATRGSMQVDVRETLARRELRQFACG